jgi:hypothetical protein
VAYKGSSRLRPREKRIGLIQATLYPVLPVERSKSLLYGRPFPSCARGRSLPPKARFRPLRLQACLSLTNDV